MATKAPKKPKKNPVGRPALVRGEKTKGLTLKLPPSEREAYEKAAADAELTLAAWIRQACAEKLERG